MLNHVAREHAWAEKAKAGDARYRDYFFVYPDRTIPDQYEATLPEIFPAFAPGNFTWDDALDGWVWTTFNEWQWDLNWANPDVFVEFADIIGFLANQGADCIRLDAIAFTWKRMGTNCQNQPEVHALTQALRAAARIMAPSLIFKAEAIVGPQDVVAYLGQGDHAGKVSDLAYHNSLMVQIWSALASRDGRLLATALSRFAPIPVTSAWATYLRCHDDIGWAIDDADAADVGWSGYGHRSFLADFYAGEFPGSFATGMHFQSNPETGDRRTSGSAASLAGLESALALGEPLAVDLAIARLTCAYAMVFGFGGLPLLYMGDELGMLNDHSYLDDPAKSADNRWVHRPAMDWSLAEGHAAGGGCRRPRLRGHHQPHPRPPLAARAARLGRDRGLHDREPGHPGVPPAARGGHDRPGLQPVGVVPGPPHVGPVAAHRGARRGAPHRNAGADDVPARAPALRRVVADLDGVISLGA